MTIKEAEIFSQTYDWNYTNITMDELDNIILKNNLEGIKFKLVTKVIKLSNGMIITYKTVEKEKDNDFCEKNKLEKQYQKCLTKSRKNN